MNQIVSDYLTRLTKIGIDHSVVEHPSIKNPAEVMEHLGLPLSDALPTLIMKADNNFVAVVRKGATQLNTKQLKKELGVKNLRLANEEEFTRLTNVPVGAAQVYNPGLKTILDKRIFESEYLYGGSGSFTETIKYKTEDLKKIPGSIIVSIAEANKKRILTGDTPTGKLHVGHYVGTLENRVKLQDEYETFIILADMHALASPKISNLEYAKVKQYTLDVLLDNLSVGLDPDKVTFFVESEIPEIYELASFFSMYVSYNRALRNPTIKDEIKMKGLGDQFSLGFINYPLYQAADILCVKGELVPVGRDQEAHLEQTREIASMFNKIGNSSSKNPLFPEPQALIGRVGKLMGTDGSPKMSKSIGNTIFLSETTSEVERKVMSMYTDPTRLKATDPGHIEGNPVFAYLDAFGKESDKEQIEVYKNLYTKGQVGDVEVKNYLVKVLNTFLEPIRKRREEYNDEKILLEILRKGNQRVREETRKTLLEVKSALGFLY